MPLKIYRAAEAKTRFRPVGDGGSGINFNVSGLVAGSGYLSERLDFGSGSRARDFEWRAAFTLSNPSVVGERIELYAVTSDGTYADGSLASGGGVLTDVNRLRNIKHMGTLEVDRTGSNTQFVGSDIIEVNSRYLQVAAWNFSTTSVATGISGSFIDLTPVPDEIQS